MGSILHTLTHIITSTKKMTLQALLVLLTISANSVIVAPTSSPNPGPPLERIDLTEVISGPLETAGQIFEVVTLAVVSQVAESAVNAFNKPKRKITNQFQRPLRSTRSKIKLRKPLQKHYLDQRY